MSATDWATVISSYFIVTTGVGGIIWMFLKKAIAHVIAESKEDLKVIKSEVTPNHGSSIHDKINLEIIPMLKELRSNQADIALKVSKLEGRFEQHVDEIAN